jgi:hypothetical protein
MAVRYDIALVDNDILFQNGDMVTSQSDEQHIIDTIEAFPGWWKQYPLDGVGIMAYMKGPANSQEISKQIRMQLLNDGYNANNPTVKLDSNGQLTINPNVEAV